MTIEINTITKEEQVRRILIDRIDSGYYPENGKIDSIRTLAKEFKVSKPTMGQTISSLVTRGILKTDQGRGTFVVPTIQRSILTKTAGLLMTSSGDLYGDMSNAIVNQLGILGYHAVTVDSGLEHSNPQILNDRLTELISSNPGGIIIDGSHSYENYPELLQKLIDTKLGIVFRNKPELNGRATKVLTDDVHGFYLGAKHLLELGHRNILFIASSQFVDPGMRDGCEKAFSEFNADWDYEKRLLPGKGEQETRKKLRQALSGPNRPTAVFASQDNQAVIAYFTALELGLKVPEDLSLVGYYNTPWVEKIDISLTSISVREEEIGRTIVNQMFGADRINKKPSTTVIKPELIIRNSTAEPKLRK